MKKFLFNHIVGVIGIVCLVVSLFVAMITDSNEKKYTIQTKHGVYHTDSFRLYGKGIVFDDDQRQVIVMGDFDITSKLDK